MERDLRIPVASDPDVAELAGLPDGEPVALTAPQAASPGTSGMVLGAVDGDIGIQYRLPYLGLVYGTSTRALQQGLPTGGWVLGGETLIAKMKEPVRVTILHAVLFFREYITPEQWKAGVKPRAFKDMKEVLAAGGTVEWDNTKSPAVPPTFSSAVLFNLLIEQPKDLVSTEFSLELGGKLYAPARAMFDKTAAKSVLPSFLTAKDLALRPPRALYHGVFELLSDFKQRGNSAPRLAVSMRHVGYHTAETVAKISEIFGKAQAPSIVDTGDAGSVG